MNNFKRYGVDVDEFADALAEAMETGGAGPEEVKWAKFGALAESRRDDDSTPWTLDREP